MSSLRATRLLNAVEVGNTNAAAVEALLSDNQGRLGELRVLFGQRGQAQRIASNPTAVSVLVGSPTALSAVVDSQVLLQALSKQENARVAVRNAGNAILRRLLQSKQMSEEEFQEWPDQFQWMRQNLPALNNDEGTGVVDSATWKALTHGDTKYVVIAFNSSACATSSDGVVWTLGNLPITSAWTSVAYGGPNGAKLYVAVARNSGTIATSADGLNWVARTLPKIDDWRHIVFRDNVFRIVANGSTEEAQSSDGINWTIVQGGNTFTQNVTINGGAQGTPITLNLTSTGTATIPKGTQELNVTGRGSASSLGAVSTMSINPNVVGEGTGTELFHVAQLAYGNGVWLGGFNTYNALGGGGNLAPTSGWSRHHIRSANGYDWQLVRPSITRADNNSPDNERGLEMHAMTFDPHSGLFIAASNGDHYHFTSTDGLNWKSWYGGLSSGACDLAAGNGRVVAVYGESGGASNGAGARLSTNGGQSFTEASFTDNTWNSSTPQLNHVAYGNGKFVAINKTGLSAGSPDGGYWTRGGILPSIGTGYWRDLIFAGGYFVALAQNGTGNNPGAGNSFAYSTDGTTWALGSLSATRLWTSIGWHQGRFIANATTGETCSSANLINWTNGTTAGAGMVGVSPESLQVAISVPRRLAYNQLVTSWNAHVSLDGQTWQRQRYVAGVQASVTVNGQAYTYFGSTTMDAPAPRTDTIPLDSGVNTVISYSAPAGTVLTGTFIASDIQVPLTGSGSVTVPIGTTKLKITARGAAGSQATTVAIPNTSSEGKWSSPAYGNSKWVSVHSDLNPANQHNVATSTDGINWTTAEMPGGFKGWTDVAFGAGRFVAIRSGDSGQIFAHSTDGLAWVTVQPTALAVAAAGRWTSIAFAAGKFVAVGSGTTANVVTSSDGMTWATANIAGGLKWNGVTYGGDRFVAVSSDVGANGANNIAHSTDGLAWTRVGIGGNTTLTFNNVVYGGGVFVAVGSRVATSADGIAWSLSTALGYSLEDVSYGAGRFVASYASNGTAAPVSSTDGLTWTAGALPNATPVQGRYASITFANNLFVSIATIDGQVAYSANGQNWTTSSPASTGQAATVTIFGITHTFPGSLGGTTPAEVEEDVTLNINQATTVTYSTPSGAASRISYSGGSSTQVVNTPATVVAYASGGGRHVAIALDGKVAGSADGVNWAVMTMPAAIQWCAVAYGAGKFVALAYDSSISATSTDGLTWTQRAMPTSAKWSGLVLGTVASNPRFLALSEFSTIVAYSADGITWTQTAIPALPASNIEAGTLTNVTLSGSASATVPAGVTNLQITGRGGAGVSEITTPTYGADGSTWTSGASLSNNSWIDVVYGGGTFVALRSDSFVATSSDGTNWVQRAVTGAAFRAIGFASGRFVLVSDTAIKYSADGITWTDGTGVTRGGDAIAFGGGRFVVVRKHASANLSHSPDGITWTEGSIVSGTGLWAAVAYGGGKFVAVNNLNSNNVAHSVDGLTWTVISGPVVSLKAICYGGNRFLALAADGNTAYTSTDGVAWTASTNFPTLSGGNTWVDLVWGNGKYLVVGNNGRVAYSADASNWTQTVAGHATSTWNGVAYGNGRMVVVGAGATATSAVSADTVTGSTVVTPAQAGANATVTVGGTPYVFAGSMDSSTPGYTAYSVTLNPANATIVDYTVPVGTAAALSYIAAAVAVSPVNPQLPVATAWSRVAFGNGVFVAVATGTSICATSADGINWVQRSMPVATAWVSVRFLNGLFVALSSVSSIYATSTDGITWAQREMPQVASIGQGNAVTTPLVNNTGTTDVLSLKYNGAEVTVGNLPEGIWSSDQMASNGTRAVMRSSAGLLSSVDGINWNRDPSGAATTLYGQVIWSPDKGFYASSAGAGSTTGMAYYKSQDGVTWTVSVGTKLAYTQGGATFQLYPKSAAAGPNRYVGVWSDVVYPTTENGLSDTLYATGLRWSTDGVNWSSLIMPTVTGNNVAASLWEEVAYGNGMFVAIRGRGAWNMQVWVSTDGENWTQQSTGSSLQAGISARVFFENGYFFLFSNESRTYTQGSNNTVYISGGTLNARRGTVSGGTITWEDMTVPEDTQGTHIHTLMFGAGKWMAVADRGRSWPGITPPRGAVVLSSTDGMNWTHENVPEPGTTSRLGWEYGTFVNNRFVIGDLPTQSGSQWGNRFRLAYMQAGTTDWTTTAQNTTGALRVPEGITSIVLTGQGGTNNGGSEFVVRLRGVNYSFPGSASSTPPAAKSYTIALDGSNQNELTYTLRDGSSGSFSYSPQTTVYSHANWSDASYGNGVSAAVATGKNAAYSSDNVNWTLSTLPVEGNWVDMAFGGGVHVVVGAGSRCLTTNDGITWTARTLPNDLNWSAVAYGAGRFVAFSREPSKINAAAHSPDGITWSAITLPVAAEWTDVCYRNGVFLAISANNNVALTSADGIIWTQRLVPQTANWSAMATDGDRILGIALGSTNAFITFDGVTFNQSSPSGTGTLPGSGASSRWNNIVYGNGVFVAMAKNSSIVVVSADGMNWTAREMPSDSSWNAVGYGNGKFVALAENTTIAAYSTDGMNWIASALPVSQRWMAVVAGSRGFVAVSADSTVSLSSRDGITWTARTMAANRKWVDVAYGNNLYVAVSENTDDVATSPDGITWTLQEAVSPGLNAITFGNGVFVGLCSNDAGVDVSVDGINWLQYGLPALIDWSGITFGNGVFVAVARTSALVATSKDGRDWSTQSLPNVAAWRQVAYGGGVFVAITDTRVIATNC